MTRQPVNCHPIFQDVGARFLICRETGFAYLAAAYFLSMLLATYFNVAFYHEILAALKGDEVSLQRGLAFALTRWQAILLWTLFAGLVGLVIRKLEERLGFVGRLVFGLIGTAWSVACIFVVPVLVTDTKTINPIELLKESAHTLKETWGESLIGFVGVRFGGLLLVLGSLVFLGAAAGVSIAIGSYWMIAVAGFVWFSSVMAFSYVLSVAGQVYRCALFIYSTERTVPEPYSPELLQMAWKSKK